MKVFISTDFEGTSGIVAWEQVIEGNPEYAHGRALLTAEVNAAIEGAVAGGATDIVVNDAHHNMRRDQGVDGRLAGDMPVEAHLVERARVVAMREDGDLGADRAMVAHEEDGVKRRIQSLHHVEGLMLAADQGRLAGELIGSQVAHYGVPIALVTGDRATADESAWVAESAERVVVKESIGRFAASNLHPDVARQMIRAGAERAMHNAGQMRPPIFERPARLEMQFLTADMAEMATWIGGVERTGPRTVAMHDDDTLALYRRFVAITYLTREIAE